MKQLFTLLFVITSILAKAQSITSIQAQKSLGGLQEDAAYSIQQTTDGDYIVAGYTSSNDGIVTGNHGGADYWVIKFNAAAILWKKCFGGSSNDYAHCVQQTSDGGYIIAGGSASSDGDVSGNHGYGDYWIIKLNAAGSIQWQKNFGGYLDDIALSIQETKDSGYIIAGYTRSNDGDVIGCHGEADYWVIKMNASGIVQWKKCFGGSSSDYAQSIQQTRDGGYIVTGYSYSNDGDVSGHHEYGGGSPFADYWIIKLDAAGSMQWQKSLGGTSEDYAHDIRQTKDGGYVVAGYSLSDDGDVSGNHGSYDYWILKLNSAGNIQWQKSMGGSDADASNSIRQTKDGGYIIAGSSRSNDGNVSGNHGTSGFYNNDYWILKLNYKGNIQWQKCLGGTFSDNGQCIEQTKDGNYIIAGDSYSNDGDVTFHHGSSGKNDYWIIKLNASGELIAERSMLNSATAYNSQSANHPINQLTVSPNPVQSILHIQGLSSSMNYELRIMNESGIVLLQSSTKNTSSYDMDISKLASGIYYLQEGKEKIKFLKQ